MTEQSVTAAVEKILSDPAFAKAVHEKPEETLTSNFKLEPGEWQSIAWCLNQDVQDALTEKFFSSLSYRVISQVPQLQGTFDRYAAGPTAIPGINKQQKY
jgi:hypothetical protein